MEGSPALLIVLMEPFLNCHMVASVQWGRTRVRGIRFFYLKSNVFWSIFQQSFNLRFCWFYTFSFKMYMPTEKYFGKELKNYALWVKL